MMLTREKRILDLLMENGDKLTTTQIADALKVSSRTIKADVKKINEQLDNHFCRINSQQGVGLWIEYDNAEGERYLKELLKRKSNTYLLPEIRKYHFAVELLFQNDYISMETLAKEYYISRASVLNDLSELDTFWDHFNLKLIKKVKYGIKVEGTESQIRSALIEALKQAEGRKETGIVNIQRHFESIDLERLREIVNQIERRFQFVLTDTSVEELIIAVAVMLKRLSQGRQMDQADSFDHGESRRMNLVLRHFKERLAETEGIRIPETENLYLSICLRGLRFHIPMEKERTLAEKRDRNPDMFDTVIELLADCDRKFSLNMKNDNELIGALMDHLECMILRMNSKLYTYNPILEAIKKELFYEYEVASYFMSKFSAIYQFKPKEDEIGFITFHMGTSIERMKQKTVQKYTVSIVCTTGYGTSQFLRVKLGSHFPNLKINKVISVSRIEELSPGEQDLVITTVPLELESTPVVRISPVLSGTDVKKIRNFLLDEKETTLAQDNKYRYLRKFLHNEITILNCDLKSREEVIWLLGGRMNSEEYTDENFINSVFERENLSETAIGNLIAIPHAFEGHIKKQGIGVMTLKKPISWGEEKVQIIFMLSLDAASQAHIKNIFMDVLELTRDKKAVENILRAKKYTELFK